jgi:hypothetical protein
MERLRVVRCAHASPFQTNPDHAVPLMGHAARPLYCRAPRHTGCMTTQTPDPQPTPDPAPEPAPTAVAVAGTTAQPDPQPAVDADALEDAVERADITPKREQR